MVHFELPSIVHSKMQTIKIMISKILLPLFCCLTFALSGQDSIQLTNDFEFKSGVYLTIEDLQANEPNYIWDDIQASAHINREKQIVRLEYLNVLDSNAAITDHLLENNIWGICVGGVPYIRIMDSVKQVVQFVALRTRGQYCYFQYDSYQLREVPMTIYDPETGNAIWEQSVENKEAIRVHKMLNFSTGSVADLNLPTFKRWIKNDVQLTNTVNDMTTMEAKKKLYKMLLIYNDRNPYFFNY